MNDKSKNRKNYNNCFRYYKEAIKGRNFHYSNYNKWVNLYSIFTGALFIGYYTIFEQKILCPFLPLIIGLLGIVSSLCWLQSVRGYYCWMLSWIKIVHKYEKKLCKLSGKKDKNSHFVYSVYLKPKKSIFYKNLSTQKITVFFTVSLVLGWNMLFGQQVFLLLKNRCPIFFRECSNLLTLFSFIICFFITSVVFIFTCSFESSTAKMKNCISLG